MESYRNTSRNGTLVKESLLGWNPQEGEESGGSPVTTKVRSGSMAAPAMSIKTITHLQRTHTSCLRRTQNDRGRREEGNMRKTRGGRHDKACQGRQECDCHSRSKAPAQCYSRPRSIASADHEPFKLATDGYFCLCSSHRRFSSMNTSATTARGAIEAASTCVGNLVSTPCTSPCAFRWQ